MNQSLQREWLTDILETTPSIVFLALWRSNVDMQLSGWIGAALAATLLVASRYFRIQFQSDHVGNKCSSGDHYAFDHGRVLCRRTRNQ